MRQTDRVVAKGQGSRSSSEVKKVAEVNAINYYKEYISVRQAAQPRSGTGEVSL